MQLALTSLGLLADNSADLNNNPFTKLHALIDEQSATLEAIRVTANTALDNGSPETFFAALILINKKLSELEQIKSELLANS